MRRLWQIIQALFEALALTLRGETRDAATRYPQLNAWVQQGLGLVQQALQTADASGFDEARRRAITVRVEGRDTSMQTILAATQHNLTREYPLLLETKYEHNLTTLYAMNLNDQYRVTQLAQAEAVQAQPAMQQAIAALAAHLADIPPGDAASDAAQD